MQAGPLISGLAVSPPLLLWGLGVQESSFCTLSQRQHAVSVAQSVSAFGC